MVVGEFVEHRDLIVIGGGPGGYHAAIRAAQLGLQVTLIEKAQLGGVCLNVGCIPSKIVAHAAKEYASISDLQSLGISTGKPTFDYAKLLDYQAQTIRQLRKGVASLCAENKIEILEGEANFTAENRIGVEQGHQFDVYEFNHAIIATGSTMVQPAFLSEQSDRVLMADSVYKLNGMPKALIIYGSDYIALEVACSFSNLGAEVTMILDNGKTDFQFDSSINRELKRILKKQKISVKRGYVLNEMVSSAAHVDVYITKNGKEEMLTGDYIYIKTEKEANINHLGLQRFGVKTTSDGFIETDKQMKTSLPHLFAVGDATTGELTAVKAMKQGKVAAETAAGKKSEADLTFVPAVVHSVPPIATVGLTEQEAIKQGYQVKISQFSYNGNSMAMITNAKDGLAKIVKDAETDLLLGFHVVGASAVELISSGTIALEMAGRDEDVTFPLYPHPSFNETMLEAVEGLTGKATHIPPVK